MEPRRDNISSEWTNSISDGGLTANDPAVGNSSGAPEADPSVPEKEKLFTRFLRWLYPDQRKAARHTFPPMVSYLGTHRAQPPYRVADVGVAGFYMLTIERWLPGTEMPVTLQRIDAQRDKAIESITLPSRVVRCGNDGVGFAFLLIDGEGPASESAASKSGDSHVGRANRRDVERFLEGIEQSDLNSPQLERASKPLRDDLPCFPQ